MSVFRGLNRKRVFQIAFISGIVAIVAIGLLFGRRIQEQDPFSFLHTLDPRVESPLVVDTTGYRDGARTQLFEFRQPPNVVLSALKAHFVDKLGWSVRERKEFALFKSPSNRQVFFLFDKGRRIPEDPYSPGFRCGGMSTRPASWLDTLY